MHEHRVNMNADVSASRRDRSRGRAVVVGFMVVDMDFIIVDVGFEIVEDVFA